MFNEEKNNYSLIKQLTNTYLGPSAGDKMGKGRVLSPRESRALSNQAWAFLPLAISLSTWLDLGRVSLSTESEARMLPTLLLFPNWVH